MNFNYPNVIKVIFNKEQFDSIQSSMFVDPSTKGITSHFRYYSEPEFSISGSTSIMINHIYEKVYIKKELLE